MTAQRPVRRDYLDDEILPLGPEDETWHDDEEDEFWADWMAVIDHDERVADDLDDARTYQQLRPIEDHELPDLKEVAGDG